MTLTKVTFFSYKLKLYAVTYRHSRKNTTYHRPHESLSSWTCWLSDQQYFIPTYCSHLTSLFIYLNKCNHEPLPSFPLFPFYSFPVFLSLCPSFSIFVSVPTGNLSVIVVTWKAGERRKERHTVRPKRRFSKNVLKILLAPKPAQFGNGSSCPTAAIIYSPTNGFEAVGLSMAEGGRKEAVDGL